MGIETKIDESRNAGVESIRHRRIDLRELSRAQRAGRKHLLKAELFQTNRLGGTCQPVDIPEGAERLQGGHADEQDDGSSKYPFKVAAATWGLSGGKGSFMVQ